MIVTLPAVLKGCRAVTDNSRECDGSTLFLVTSLNARFIDDARAHGATETVTPSELMALLPLERMAIIGITGTNGKTTTAAALYSTLLDLGYKVALQGTRGFYLNDSRIEEKSLTTPMPLDFFAHLVQALEAGCDYFVTEVSSHAIAQGRIEGVPFTLKILTNITQDHLDYHKTFEAYRDVKNSFLADAGLKLVNKDEKEATFHPKGAYTYGIEDAATFKIESYSLNDGIAAVVRFGEEIESFYSPMRGFFNLYNLLAAVAAAKIVTKRSLSDVCNALENFGGVSGRMEVVSTAPLVIVDFAHTPDGIAKVLDALKEKSLLVVLGAGGDRDPLKRPRMGYEAALRAKKVFVTSDNPRGEEPMAIIRQICAGISDQSKVVIEPDRREAIRLALAAQCDDDCVLILGKGDETYQQVGDHKHPFDDRLVAGEFLNKA